MGDVNRWSKTEKKVCDVSLLKSSISVHFRGDTNQSHCKVKLVVVSNYKTNTKNLKNGVSFD